MSKGVIILNENPSSLINLPEIPSSVDNAVQNLTDKPTLAVANTFTDIWNLVFGGISYQAKKKEIKYAYNLELFRKQLESSIDQISPDKVVEPSIQTTAQALENSKYCIDEEKLRDMFAALISNSMNSDYKKDIHPSFAEILKQMSPLDAEIIRVFKHADPSGLPLCQYLVNDGDIYKLLLEYAFLGYPTTDLQVCSLSISSLSRLGLLEPTYETRLTGDDKYTPFEEHIYIKNFQRQYPNENVHIRKGRVLLTPLGWSFSRVCIPD